MTRILTIFLSVVCMVYAMSGLVVAQQQGKTVARIVFHQEVPANQMQADRPQNLKGALKALRQETQQSQASTRKTTAPPQSSPSSSWPTQRPSNEPLLLNLRPSTPEPNAIDDIGNTDDIEERIDLLKRIYEAKRIENQRKITEAALVMPAKKMMGAIQPVPDRSQVEPPAVAVSAPMAVANSVQESPEMSPGADRIFPAPVNAFELGNSLYYTGDLQLALEAYEQVDRTQITAIDGVWLDFMIASCHRRLGQWDEATSLYRDIANQNVAPNLTQPAQLWLKQLQLTSQSKTSFQQMESEISSLIETAQQYVKP